jgi:hypothetical protein
MEVDSDLQVMQTPDGAEAAYSYIAPIGVSPPLPLNLNQPFGLVRDRQTTVGCSSSPPHHGVMLPLTRSVSNNLASPPTCPFLNYVLFIFHVVLFCARPAVPFFSSSILCRAQPVSAPSSVLEPRGVHNSDHDPHVNRKCVSQRSDYLHFWSP